MMHEASRHPSSFRDPSGHIFVHDGELFRTINDSYIDDYRRLMRSGLYEQLIERRLLVQHREVQPGSLLADPRVAAVVQPELVPFISYPYEWSFSQLKDAALATLQIQELAFAYGLCLKDASAYNIQFTDGRPLLIDTLSFQPHIKGEPWVAYRQFCQHFLAPLALMAHVDVRCGLQLRQFIDGVPLDFASSLLPRKTWLSPGLLMHVHLHAKSQARFGGVSKPKAKPVSSLGLRGIIDSLKTSVSRLQFKSRKTEWGDYYNNTNYNSDSFRQKRELLQSLIARISPEPVRILDIGANNGYFSSQLASADNVIIAADIDPVAVDAGYTRRKHQNDQSNIYPLVLDMTNPSPGLGWDNKERKPLFERANADVIVSLALIHHLAISNNLPLALLAKFYASHAKSALIEFVPKSDSQVEKLLATREDVFPDYHEEGFEAAFHQYFQIIDKNPIPGSKRSLYLLTRLDDHS